MNEAVIGIVLTPDKKIVLTKRADAPIWVLPGGGIDHGESPEEAILREIKEETGLQVKIHCKSGEYTPINALAAKTHVYACEIEGGFLQTSAETTAVATFDPTKLPYPFFTLHKDWLKDWLNYKGQITKKKITQINYFSIIKFFIFHPVIFIKFVINKKLLKTKGVQNG